MPPIDGLCPTKMLTEMRQVYTLGKDGTWAFRYHFYL